MTHVQKWQDVLARIAPGTVPSLDDLLAPLTPRARNGGGCVWGAGPSLPLAPEKKPDARECIGVRIAEAESESVLAARAAMLAALAIEHQAEVIVLSHLDYCGLERFGFRVERVAGETPEEKADCEAQLRAFWGIEIMI